MANEICMDPDSEVIQMVNANAERAARQDKLDRQRIQRIQRLEVGGKTESECASPYRFTKDGIMANYHESTAQKQVKRLFPAAARSGVGLIFIGGMARGLMDPGFAVAAMLACVGWGLATYLRK